MQEAGGTCVQELAYTMADGIEYVRAAIASGLKIDDFAPRLSFFFCIGMNFFMEVAKLRAARQLWSELVSEQFSPKDPRSLMLRMHCQTSGVSLASQDPYNNIIRTTVEALAGVLGGTQSLHTNSFDEALALPTDFAARIARNTQLVLREETGVTDVVDPLGGSYYVESLTSSLVSEARKLIDEVEALGGMTEAVSAGLPKLRILEAAARRQARIDQGEEVIVGVNRYQLDEEEQVEILSVDNIAVRDAQLRRLESVRLARDEDRCQEALQILEHAATKEVQNNNLLACAMDAARVRATVGEISTALEKVFGRHRAETITISGVYGAAVKDDKSFSSTQAAIRSFADRVGRQPRLLVAKLGQDGHDRGASVIATAFADLGFDVDIGPLFQTPADAVRQAVENDVHIIGISSQAAAHRTLIPEVMVELERQGASDIIVVLGGVIPAQDHAEMYKLGVAAIYGPGAHIPAAAQDIMDLLGQRQR